MKLFNEVYLKVGGRLAIGKEVIEVNLDGCCEVNEKQSEILASVGWTPVLEKKAAPKAEAKSEPKSRAVKDKKAEGQKEKKIVAEKPKKRRFIRSKE